MNTTTRYYCFIRCIQDTGCVWRVRSGRIHRKAREGKRVGAAELRQLLPEIRTAPRRLLWARAARGQAGTGPKPVTCVLLRAWVQARSGPGRRRPRPPQPLRPLNPLAAAPARFSAGTEPGAPAPPAAPGAAALPRKIVPAAVRTRCWCKGRAAAGAELSPAGAAVPHPCRPARGWAGPGRAGDGDGGARKEPALEKEQVWGVTRVPWRTATEACPACSVSAYRGGLSIPRSIPPECRAPPQPRETPACPRNSQISCRPFP